MENIAEYLYSRRARDLPAQALAELFERLIWTMDDNGAEICERLIHWVESGDLERARVAIAVKDVFLFPTRDAMVAAFDRLCSRFPELRMQCDERLNAWDAQYL